MKETCLNVYTASARFRRPLRRAPLKKPMTPDRPIYLDNNASAPMAPEAREAMVECMRGAYGNPSSLHRLGVEASRMLEDARARIARFLGVDPRELVFTSGATESVNMALLGAAAARRRNGNRILTTAVEHESTLAVCRHLQNEGFQIDLLETDRFGRVCPAQIADAVQEKTILAAVGHVNGELGTVNPAAELAHAVKRKNPRALFFSDGAQAFGKMPIQMRGVDLYAASAHKLHGPRGIGALVVRGATVKPLMFGGGQERGMRPGTENLPAAVGFAAAVEAAYENMPAWRERMRALRRRFLKAVMSINDARVNSPEDGLETTVNAAFLGVPAAALSSALEARGVFASTGSACSSSKRAVSSVLAALPMPEAARRSSLRFSFSRYTTERDMDAAAEALRGAVAALRPLYRLAQ